MALPNYPPRPVGLRPASSAFSRAGQARREVDGRRGSDLEDGLLFLFDRATGEPISEIEERSVPESDMSAR